MALVLALILTSILVSCVHADCNDGWTSCDASIWVSPKFAGEHPDVLDSYTPGEIRGPLEYEIKFSCRGRRAGYYADLDHGCKIWHYCNTTRELNPQNGLSTWTYMHFSYACTEQDTRYDQVLKECIPESRALVGCRESELYYPTGEYVHDVPVTIHANTRLVPVRCPQSPVRCQVQKDHIALSSCPDAPGAVLKFYSDSSESDVPATGPSLVYGAGESSSSTSNSDEEAAGLDSEAPATSAPAELPAPDASLVPHAPTAPRPGPKVTFYAATSDAGKTNPFRFRETPAAAARKTAQAKGQSKNESPARLPAPPRRLTVVSIPEPVRRIYVTDLSQQRFEQSKTNQAWASKSAAVVSRKTITSPTMSEVKTHYYSHETKEDHYPFIESSHQLVFPRRLTDPLQIPTIPQPIRDAISAANGSESAEADFLGLPIGSTKIIGERIDTTFDCTGRTYGYYADVRNQCKVYHVCSPKTDEFGVKFYEHYSFVCSEGLVFDQQKITCLPARESSTPCADSDKYFSKTASIFHEGNETWKRNRLASSTTTSSPVAAESAQPAYVDIVPSEPLTTQARKSVHTSSKVFASGSEQVFASPSRILKGKHTKTSQISQDEEESQSVQQESQQQQQEEEQQQQVGQKPAAAKRWPAADAAHPADNSENGQGHKPSITQKIVRSGGQRVFHNPRITQQIQSPAGSPSDSQQSHSPSIDQYIAQPAQPSSFRTISHNPSITQFVSQPATPSDHQIIAHNPSISQYISQPAAPAPGDQAISHNPSITQYIAQPSAPAPGDQVISHNPSISQYVAGAGAQIPAHQRISHSPSISQYIPQPAGPASNSVSISHNPSISQVINLPEYARPSGRS